MVSEARARRIKNRIHQELSILLQREVADPRLSLVTVTAVDVDRELAYATIYVTAGGAKERMNEVLNALEGARGYLRRELVGRIHLRSFPQLRFHWDASQERGARVDELLEMLNLEQDESEGENSEA